MTTKKPKAPTKRGAAPKKKTKKKSAAGKTAKRRGALKKAWKTKTTRSATHKLRCGWLSDGETFCIREQGHAGKHEDIHGYRW